MWCYQKPGFEALLLAELQKQQQCSHFCDTLLKAGGVSVPAHSCILSAVSPHISSTLSSTPVPPAGQTRLLEFRTVGACTMLHMVRLLYSGEMAGEGEKEKQEAISAAAKLGIQGLVEVTKKDLKSRNKEGRGLHRDVGVQTEPLIPEESEVRLGRWRREVKDGSTILWKEVPSNGQKNICTQTEELQINTTPPAHPAASFKTIDVSAVQGLGQTASNLPPQIPYVPISLVYQPDENETLNHSSDPAASMQDSTLAGSTSVAVVAPPYTSVPLSFHSFPNQATSCAADTQGWGTDGPPCPHRDVESGEEWENEQLKQFQGNIPGFISHFLNPDKEASRGRAGRRRGARVRGARSAGTGERRARRPQGRPRGRGRGGLTQMVDVQDVGVSKLQKLFLQRGGVRASKPGQGGGAVGRQLYLKTRELLKPAKSCQRRRRHCKEWEFSQSGDVLRLTEGGDNKQSGGRNTQQQVNQDVPPTGRAWCARAKPTASSSLSTPPMRLYSVQTLSGSSSSLQHSPSPSLFSPAAAYVSPALSLLHTTALPPPPPPHHEEQPEHIDRLLEEVMMGLDILTNNNSSSSSAFSSSTNNLTKDKQQNRTADLPEARPGFHCSTQVHSSCANNEVPILQQQEEGELTDILDHFLQSFEQHIDNCSAREKEEISGERLAKTSQPYTVLSKYRKTNTQSNSPHPPHLHNTRRLQSARRSQTTELQQSDKAETQLSLSQTCKAAACSIVPPKHAAGTSRKAKAPARPKKKRGTSQILFSLEIKKKKKSVSSTDRKPRIFPDRDKQLQQKPVVRLERSGPLPVRVTLKELCQSREVKNSAKTKTSSSPRDSLSKKNQPAWWSTKIYPIRSRLREANIVDSLFEEPCLQKSGRRRGRPKKNMTYPRLSDCKGSTPEIQLQPVEPCDTDKQLEENHERHGEDLTVQPQEETEGHERRGKKRGAELEEEASDDATAIKKVCFEQTAPLTSETCIPSSDSADFDCEAAAVEMEDVIDVETVSLISLQTEDDKKAVWSEIIMRTTEDSLFDDEMESSSDEIINVDEDSDGNTDLEKDGDNCKERAEKDCCQSRLTPALPDLISPPSRSAKHASLGSTGSWEDEDVDVIGGSCPVPDPVIISWRESSEGEGEEGDKDVDVVSEKTDST